MDAGLKSLVVVLAAMACLAGCGAPDPLSDLEPGERARVVRVIDGDALVLQTGLTVRLAGITAPSPAWKDRVGEPFAEEATIILERLALGREVQVFYGGLSRDRYGRAIAQVRTVDGLGPTHWLNLEMVREGGARVRVYPDNEMLAATLLTAEEDARTARSGLWSDLSAHPRDASSLPASVQGFVILEGWVVPAAPPREAGRAFAGDGYRPRPVACRLGFGQLVIEVAPTAVAACATPPGVRARVRGWLSDGRLRLDSAANLQRLGD